MSFETGRWFLLCGIISHHKGKYKQWAIKRCQPWRAPTWANWPLWTTTLVPVVPGHFSLPPAEYERTEQYLWSPATNQEMPRAYRWENTQKSSPQHQDQHLAKWRPTREKPRLVLDNLPCSCSEAACRECQQATQELTSLTAKVSPWLECYISGKIQLTKLIKALHAAP